METLTFEEILPSLDALSNDDKLRLVNKIRANFGFPAMTFTEAIATGGFTDKEKEIVDSMISN